MSASGFPFDELSAIIRGENCTGVVWSRPTIVQHGLQLGRRVVAQGELVTLSVANWCELDFFNPDVITRLPAQISAKLFELGAGYNKVVNFLLAA
jgi:hypothetical protein